MKLLVFVTLLAAVTAQVKADQTCQECLMVSGYISSALELNNSTKAEMKNDLEQICIHLATSSECTSIVDQYFSDIVQFLQVGQLEPKAVCQQLELCSATKSPELELKDQQTCAVCKVVMIQIDHFLGDNPTEEKIIEAIRGVCDEFPDNYYDNCNSYMDIYAYGLFHLLMNGMEPDKICTELGLCDVKQQLDEKTQVKDKQTMTNDLQYPVKTTELKDTINCTVCEIGLKDLDDYILQKFTESEITSILENDCDSLESAVAAECHDLLDTYGVDIIKLAVQRLDPKDICTRLGYCEGAQVKVTVRDGEICHVCKLVGQEILSVLQSNATEEEIEQALEQVCGFLPQSLSQECDSLVEKYGAETFRLLQKLTPDELCKDMYLCEDKALVDDNKCMIGPKFWCASPANAKMCNAVQHCKNHVW